MHAIALGQCKIHAKNNWSVTVSYAIDNNYCSTSTRFIATLPAVGETSLQLIYYGVLGTRASRKCYNHDKRNPSRLGLAQFKDR